jgi:hypothetical protein
MAKYAYFLEVEPPVRSGDLPDLFPGSVPPLEVFEWNFNNLSRLVASFEYDFFFVDSLPDTF